MLRITLNSGIQGSNPRLWKLEQRDKDQDSKNISINLFAMNDETLNTPDRLYCHYHCSIVSCQYIMTYFTLSKLYANLERKISHINLVSEQQLNSKEPTK